MSVKVTRKGGVKWTPDKALDKIVSTAIGMIQRRTARGIDADGQPFRPYSHSYTKALRAGGESTKVDLTVTGAFLLDVVEKRREVRGTGARAWIGLGTGTSMSKSFGGGVAHDTGRRSPRHNVLGAYFQNGTPRMPARKWLGWTPDERKRLAALVRKLLVQRR